MTRMLNRFAAISVTVTLAIGVPGAQTAHAARLSGVMMPDTETIGATRLILNGVGLRTYSVLGIRIYVAGLYLEHPDHDANAILNSSNLKVLRLQFVHDVSAAEVRHAWRTGLTNNCATPCTLSAATLDHFLNSLQAVHAGEDVTLVFGRYGLNAYIGNRLMGNTTNLHLAPLCHFGQFNHSLCFASKKQMSGGSLSIN